MSSPLPRVAAQPATSTAAADRSFIPIAHPLLGEEEQQAVQQVLASGALVQGKRVAEFEARFAEYVGVKHAVAVTNGTLALWVALLAYGVGHGDEVITSPFSFIASANAALYVGAKPVFVDIDPDTYTLKPDAVRAALTPRTRAIMPVHLYGGLADMDALLDISAQHHIPIVEDACQAHGAALHGKRAGSFGIGCFSFYPTKNMTTAEGGILTTDDDHIADQARLLRNHGQREKYIHETLGFNFRMTELQAAIGLVQINTLEAWTERRIANAAYLSTSLTGVQTPYVRPDSRHVFHQYTIRVPAERRSGFIQRLSELGIGTAIHYPRPIHQQPVYQKLGYTTHLPIAEQAAQEVVSLPVHPALSQADLTRIVEAVHLALNA
ncbi:MAG TPA: DegT/DnrJ/EryC1/StrS family aminotransferase [Anaerolineae bacterium]|nr:DegT/DnrJ/EryC1/StrS family aminotransferase [Anaerolineae bacterium]